MSGSTTPTATWRRAMRESDVVVEDTFPSALRHAHCCMGVVRRSSPSSTRPGNLPLYSNTQVPFLHKREFAEVLGIDPARIRIIQPPIGGGFGSKLDIYPFEPICVFLAGDRAAREAGVHARRGVPRLADAPAVVLHLKRGLRQDGTLTFRDVRMTLTTTAPTPPGARPRRSS